jgi:hypothetical protein
MFYPSRLPLLLGVLAYCPIPSFAQGPAIVDSDLVTGPNGVRFQGVAPSDQAGTEVSLAGDLNGDGFDDLAIGAPQASSGGVVYVVFGEPLIGDLPISLSQAAEPPNGFSIFGESGENLGLHVASGGDFNADGFDDLIVVGGEVVTQSDQAYIVYGSAAPEVVSVDTLAGDQGLTFRTPGAAAVDSLNGAFVGDLNGDGFDDAAFGAPRANNIDGAVYVLFGRPAAAAGQVDLVEHTDLDGSNGFAILGENQWAFGHRVAGSGDTNGDGLDDFIAGAPAALNGSQEMSGGALLVFGSSSFGSPGAPGATSVDELANGEDGVLIEGETAFDQAGHAVALSDLNGDGLADVTIGAPLRDAGGTDAGVAYVLYGDVTWGSAGAPAVLSLGTLDETTGVVVVGEALKLIGSSLASSSDANGDGIEDLLVGDAKDQVLVVLGSPSLAGVGSPPTIATADLWGAVGYVVFGEPGNGFGTSVSAGDADGDGLADILVGSPSAPAAGEAFLLLGDLDGEVDGVPNGFDNCLEIQNPDQRDTNGDVIGNRCDPDLDNDGIVNFADLSLLQLVFFTQGPDLDEDFNGDAVVNFLDLSIMKQFLFLPPGPSGLLP